MFYYFFHITKLKLRLYHLNNILFIRFDHLHTALLDCVQSHGGNSDDRVTKIIIFKYLTYLSETIFQTLPTKVDELPFVRYPT